MVKMLFQEFSLNIIPQNGAREQVVGACHVHLVQMPDGLVARPALDRGREAQLEALQVEQPLTAAGSPQFVVAPRLQSEGVDLGLLHGSGPPTPLVVGGAGQVVAVEVEVELLVDVDVQRVVQDGVDRFVGNAQLEPGHHGVRAHLALHVNPVQVLGGGPQREQRGIPLVRDPDPVGVHLLGQANDFSESPEGVVQGRFGGQSGEIRLQLLRHQNVQIGETLQKDQVFHLIAIREPLLPSVHLHVEGVQKVLVL